jgi:hypothetical protein
VGVPWLNDRPPGHDSPPRRVVRVVRQLSTSAVTVASMDVQERQCIPPRSALRILRRPVSWAGGRTMGQFENPNRPTAFPVNSALARAIGPIGPASRREGDGATRNTTIEGGRSRSSPVRSLGHRQASRGTCATSVQPTLQSGHNLLRCRLLRRDVSGLSIRSLRVRVPSSSLMTGDASRCPEVSNP